jgi:ArsR family transcriptional regulator
LSISTFVDKVTGMTRLIDPDVRLLAALADPVRLDILRELAGSSETCACDLTSCCTVRQPTVSHHLRVLREAGAVLSERRGNNIYYWVAPNLMERLGAIAQGLVPGRLINPEPLAARPAKPRSVSTPAN